MRSAYPDVPREVYQRHDYCRCKVDYVVGKERTNVHNNNTGKRKYVQDEYGTYVKSKEERIRHAEEMKDTEKVRKESARQKRVETWKSKKEKGYAGYDVTRIGTNEVNMSYIYSDEYKQKFNRISDNDSLNNALHRSAVSLLSRNKNSDTEGVFIINSQTGKTILNKRGEKNL